jgi:hypothetical protein
MYVQKIDSRTKITAGTYITYVLATNSANMYIYMVSAWH